MIAGWDEGGHEAELRQLVEALKLGEAVHFVGPQFDSQKAASLAFADGFVLPSLSEGLPMAVLEAWAHRVPVLMTSQCNLPEGFAADAALEIALEADRMAEGIAAFLGLPEVERRAIGDRGRRLVEERFAWHGIATQMAKVYRWLVEGAQRPAWVRVG
jgi:poly(glycerol-phosphate) alpha-glucosyltransferase